MMLVPELQLPLLTQRLTIQRPEPQDADALFALQSDPDYIEFIGQPIDRDRFDRQFERSIAGDPEHLSLAIRTAADLGLVGEIVLVPSSPGEVEIVTAIAREHRARGYAREATLAVAHAVLGIDGVTAVMVCVEESNAASMRLVESLGMVRIGRTERLGRKAP